MVAADVTDLSLDGCCLTGRFKIGEHLQVKIPRIGVHSVEVRWSFLGRTGFASSGHARGSRLTGGGRGDRICDPRQPHRGGAGRGTGQSWRERRAELQPDQPGDARGNQLQDLDASLALRLAPGQPCFREGACHDDSRSNRTAACANAPPSSSARRRWAPFSNGMISTSTGCWRRSSRRNSFRASTRPPASSSRSPPSPRGSRCGRSGRSCSGGSATWSGARTPSSSPWASWACRPSSSACCRAMPRSGSRRRCCWWCCGCSRGWRSAANMAGRRPMSPSMRRTGKRGLYTSFIQTTATLGLFAALLVVIGIRTAIGEEAFADWGWRIPFLISIVLLGAVAVDPDAARGEPGVPRDEGGGRGVEGAADRGVRALAQFADRASSRLVGAVAGQAVVWYTGQFYALFFLEKTLKVDGATANILIAIALALATPFFILFGWLSDKVGRKPIIMAGCALAALTYFPLVRSADRGGQSGAGAGPGDRAGVGHRRPGTTARSSSIRSAGTSSTSARATSPRRSWPRRRCPTPMSRRRRGPSPACRIGDSVDRRGRRGIARRRGAQGRDRSVPGPRQGRAGRGRLSGQGRSGGDRQAAGGRRSCSSSRSM